MSTVKVYPVFSEGPRLIERLGVSVFREPTWSKAILTALASRPVCVARYAGSQKAELLELANSVQRRLEAVEELVAQLSQHLDEANQLAGSLWGHSRTITRLVTTSTSLIIELWASFDNVAQFFLIFLKHILHKRISGRRAFETIAEFSGDPKAVAALEAWRGGVLHRGALSPVAWGPDSAGVRRSELMLFVPGCEEQHASLDELLRCRQLLAQTISALESHLIKLVD